MISIITSLFNSEKYIKRYCNQLMRVCSYLSRRRTEFEVIIVANSPSEIEKSYLIQLQGTITNCRVIEVERETLYASWNRGIKLSSGDVIIFWSVDDIRFGRALIKSEKLIKDGYDIVYFNFVHVWRHKYFRYVPIYKMALIFLPKFSLRKNEEAMICGPFPTLSRNIINKIGYFDEQFKVVGDYDWFIRAGRGGAKFLRNFSVGGFYIKQWTTLSGGEGNQVHKVEIQVLNKKYGKTKSENLSVEEIKMMNQYRV